MNAVLVETLAAIEAQQPKERTTVWVCGEQLKEILYYEPHLAELVLTDLGKKGMSLADCEKKIKERARAFGGGLAGPEAEEIIRKFYGLPERDERETEDGLPRRFAPRNDRAEVIELADFF